MVPCGEAFQPSNLDNQPVGMLDDGALEIVERLEYRRAQREQGPPGTYALACVDRELNRQRRNASRAARWSRHEKGATSPVAPDDIQAAASQAFLRFALPESAAGLRPRPEDLASAERVAE